MRRLSLYPLILLALGTAAFAQDEPEGTLRLRGVFTGTYSFRSTEKNSDKIGAVTTRRDSVNETWDRVTLIFTGTTKWKYRDGLPIEMKDDASVSCSGQGGLRNLTEYVTAINKGGEWAPYKYNTSEDGNWTYSVPSEPVNKALPPLMGCGGSVAILAPLGMYTLILNPYPNPDLVTATGAWTHRMRPKQEPGSLHVNEDEETKIDHDRTPPRGSMAPYLAKDAYFKILEQLKPEAGMQGTFDVEQAGFSTSGHLSDHGGPGTKTTRTDPVNKGDWQSTGLTIVTNGNWTADVSWTFTYNKSPVEAVIKPTGEYKKWLPVAGSKQGKAGSAIGFKVELRDKKTGGKPKNTTATFTFKLLDTSKEPGSCLNSPWNDTEPDLKILKRDNGGLAKIDDDGQSARSKEKLTECPISISCLDGGGYGRLQIEADLSDGPTVIAFLEDGGSEQVSLPYDEDSNHIADAWEDDKGVKGQSGEVDDEQDPPGDRTNGDGFTLWEEYRGFLEDGKHIRGNPKKKDYFIADTVGGRIKPGIKLFKDISKLEVHSDLTVEELGTDRVINRNHADGPHVVNQHGILLGQRETDGTCEAISGLLEPSTPKDIVEVVIDPQVASVKNVGGKSYDLISSFVAHELLHACCVWHHGQNDRNVWWKEEAEADGHREVYEYASADDAGHPEKGTRIAPRWENETALATTNWTAAKLVWLGMPGGQHSGCEDCVMRYDCSNGYPGGIVRYRLKQTEQEIPGMGLCADAAGTGVNDSSRRPRSRYGGATKGNCVDQIRVKDPF
ncbi:MAG: hypothetical protein ACM3VW_02375 [Bacteroidota bacterium]